MELKLQSWSVSPLTTSIAAAHKNMQLFLVREYMYLLWWKSQSLFKEEECGSLQCFYPNVLHDSWMILILSQNLTFLILKMQKEAQLPHKTAVLIGKALALHVYLTDSQYMHMVLPCFPSTTTGHKQKIPRWPRGSLDFTWSLAFPVAITLPSGHHYQLHWETRGYVSYIDLVHSLGILWLLM